MKKKGWTKVLKSEVIKEWWFVEKIGFIFEKYFLMKKFRKVERRL